MEKNYSTHSRTLKLSHARAHIRTHNFSMPLAHTCLLRDYFMDASSKKYAITMAEGVAWCQHIASMMIHASGLNCACKDS